MKKRIKAFLSLAAIIGTLTFVPAYTVAAAGNPPNPTPPGQSGSSSPAGQINAGTSAVGGSGAPTLGSVIKTIINVLLYILGAIAVVMIVIGGIRYTTSNGEGQAISSAKNTILYSVIGLIVAVMAYAIVNFVLTSFGA